MSRFLVLAVVATVLGLPCAAERVSAQPPTPQAPGPVVRPPFSPYLNLVRQSGASAIGYYGITRPQMRVMNQIQTLQTQANQVSPFATTPKEPDQPFVTGNPFGFQNYRLYFQNQFTSPPGTTAGMTPLHPQPGR